jgi:hypothetical protein
MKPLPAVKFGQYVKRLDWRGKSYLVVIKPKDRHLPFLSLVLRTRLIFGMLSVGRVALRVVNTGFFEEEVA